MKLTELKGVGPKTEALFEKIGILTVEDLIHDYPMHYERYEEPVPIGSLKEASGSDKIAVRGTVMRPVAVQTCGGGYGRSGGTGAGGGAGAGRGRTAFHTDISDGTGTIKVIWFNAPYIRSTVHVGDTCILRGCISQKGRTLSITHPEVFTEEAYKKQLRHLIPVYSLTKGLSGKTVAKAVFEALLIPQFTEEFLPEGLLKELGLMGEREALTKIHFPATEEEFTGARKRIAFDEAFLFVLLMHKLGEAARGSEGAFSMEKTWDAEEIIASLPYDLTGAQKRVWKEIEEDLTKETPMQRLIQGDVGSGKTILAFLAMAMCASNGAQSALMAPTEVLAQQHYEKLKKLVEEAGLANVRPALLTGSMKAKEKREVRRKMAAGEVNALVGTHALFSEGVEMQKLALVITDEQHRFGVLQRKALMDKGLCVHSMVMSATPIPRTLAVTFYGDFDLSVLDEKPKKRLPIKNAVVDEHWYPNAVRFVQKEVASGRQAYVICPMIEPNEEFDGAAVTTEIRRLADMLPDVKIGLLHGRMSPKDKNAVMESMKRGEIDVLVSTTVVEVGVDVPNATVMLIENAERFGLAQLHQLRGRVGRGENQSYCIFMAHKSTKKTMERLKILQESNDGFEIAEKDLKLRGPGDPAGIRQSGELGFALLDMSTDRDVMALAARAASRALAPSSPFSPGENPPLEKKFAEYARRQEENIIL